MHLSYKSRTVGPGVEGQYVQTNIKSSLLTIARNAKGLDCAAYPAYWKHL
jgi:hypothetical protein